MTTASGSFLLDTNIIIALLNGDQAIASRVANTRDLSIPLIALGELFFGAAKSARPAENIVRVEEFVSGRSTIAADVEIAREYGQMKTLLRQKGRPIPDNDLWIAATAKCRHMILVTRDGHFSEVDGLMTTDWK